MITKKYLFKLKYTTLQFLTISLLEEMHLTFIEEVSFSRCNTPEEEEEKKNDD